MTEKICRFCGDRDRAIVSYLYGDDGGFDPADRAAFETHLADCDRCTSELAAFEEVRVSLAQWSPPERIGLKTRSSWRDIPAWAQVAAAFLCLGVGAGMANLNVRYDGNGLQVRTGWSAVSSAPVVQARPSATVSATGGGTDAAPWRVELTALEQRLRADLGRPSPTGAGVGAANAGTVASAGTADLLRRVRALVEESERRQQTELALRLAEAVREVNAQRQADLVRIDRSIGAMQNNTGREMLRQRNEMLNYVSVRTAAQRPQ